ncbi:homoserine kinase [Thalassotalea nanhaiensis]|uniref:Homoserine kinase n=1 Tax=Thalassotalea nanhaiensis TaxID=3065648 RepID=A0ABY9TGE2_9GAMM|nr:homoserine kinase [Colwelliaceae bacterium SQ345]
MTIKVFAPASIGNVSVGFDVLGMAVTPVGDQLLGDIVEISAAVTDVSTLSLSGEFANKLPGDPKDNIVWHCLELFNKELINSTKSVQPVDLVLEKKMPVGSGLGSSACSVVAALVALNEYYQKPFNDSDLLFMMGKMEAQISGSLHYDNVAPCFLGGMQLMVTDTQVITRSLPTFDDYYWIMAYPGIEMSTKEARDALPKQYSRQDLISYGQTLATFIDACYRNDPKQAFANVVDVVAEPYRQSLLPKFIETKQYLLANGASAAGISGSGPTVFVVCENKEIAEQLSNYLTENYLQSPTGFVHICKADTQGARLVS